MYSILGWINTAFVVIITAPYWMSFLNRKVFHFKGGKYFRILKFFRSIHKPLGLAILIIGLLHGYLALGSFRIHTGTIIWLSMLLTAIFGGTFYKTKKKVFFKMHKGLAFLTILLLLLHLLVPSAIYLLFPT